MKNNKTLRVFILAALLVAALSSVALAASKQLTIANHTGFTIYKIFICPTQTNNWGNSLLGSDTLENHETVGLNLKNISPQPYDLKVSFVDESAIEWHEIDLTKVNAITIKDDGTAEFHQAP